MEEGIDRAADLLRRTAEKHGAKSLAALVSARLTVEDLHLAKAVLAGALGVPRLASPPHEEGEDDALLIRRDRTPNARGAALLGLGLPDAGRVKEMMEDVAAGRVRGLVVIGEDPVGEGLLAAPALGGLEALVVLDWWRSPTVEAAHVALPARAYGEFDGAFVSFEGRAQRVRAALRAPGEAEPAWRILRDLGRRLGLALEHASAAEVFQDAASTVPAFAGLTHRALGDQGMPLKGA